MGDFLRDQWWVVVIFVGTLVPLVRRFVSAGFIETLRTLDRRWIFLLMLLVSAVSDLFHRCHGPHVPGATERPGARDVRRGRASGARRPCAAVLRLRSGRRGRAATDGDRLREALRREETQDVLHGAVAGGPADGRQNTIDEVIRADYPSAGVWPGLRQSRLQVRIRSRHQGHRNEPPRALHDRCERHGHPGHPDDEGHHQRAADEAHHQRVVRLSRRQGVGAVRGRRRIPRFA